jgi:hypothetical protein
LPDGHSCPIPRLVLGRAMRTASSIGAGRRGNGGGWQIDPAEFHRIFPPLKIATNDPTQQQRDATTDQLVAELRAVIADLRQDRDHWRTEAADWKAQAQRLLPSPQQPATAEQPPETASRLRRAWRWMRATG